ncbi:MAG TPA: hypothetical protein ENG87_03715 [Candidatus Pacearchaeota archaeon]|nr:hypothetical protein BMS3Abin17_00859 [archaeon BMS3Abin17]HDK42460.1 hypothetical protein [Candidatus Pacearchaeota archaeon]HDZ61342.1 hypothetical protein [Candidatus Pacearchaeota archaeon]
MQVSTSQNNKPRIFNCWFSYDKNFNFYYISPSTSKHSKEIINNPSVAVSIVNPKMSKGVGQDVQGLMLEGTAKQVKGKELLIAYMNFLKKYPKVSQYIKFVNKKVKMKDTKIYKITPKQGIWYDEINFEDYPRRKIEFNK